MSLQQLLLDELKLWLNARVNDLQVDGNFIIPPASIEPESIEPGDDNDILTTTGGSVVWAPPVPVIPTVVYETSVFTSPSKTGTGFMSTFTPVVNPLNILLSGGAFYNWPTGYYLVTFTCQLTLDVGERAVTQIKLNVSVNSETIIDVEGNSALIVKGVLDIWASGLNVQIEVNSASSIGDPTFGPGILELTRISTL